MSSQSFELIPFNSQQSAIAITGEVVREGDRLQLQYKLTGDTSAIELPELNALPQRKDELWQHTCFEFFLGIEGEPVYWEFNLSPSGNWNIYRLSGYRQNLQLEAGYDALPFTVLVTDSLCMLNIELELSGIVTAAQSLNLSVTAVVEEQAGPISYWAIAHTGTEPDFHRRDSFTIQL